MREQLPHSFFANLRKGLPPADALSAAFASVNSRMETVPMRRGWRCGGCGGAQCGGGCVPGCGFNAYGSGSTAVVSYLEVGGS